ncbi:head maturation protease, ClpP-related [Streptomyces canus]|uniref:head maturation protease, ClpP-related n=1 Tax=Streptomyces canus TaxID=58343 RepID=UPI00036C6373|nr:head maturation protease, ClpP-related [Streptomyces canus]
MNIVMPGRAAAFAASQRERAEKQREQLGVQARDWYRITNAADSDEAEVMLYDEIGGWWGRTADDLVAELRGITAPRMRVRINSPGGSVFEGIAIANALRAHPALVTVQVDSIAASIASVIAMAGDRIEMAPNSMLMIHDASGLCMGNASDMEEMAELLDLISDNIADAYAARAGGTRDEWRARMRAETWYLPEDAVDNGLADAAIAAPKAADPVEEPVEEDEPDMARPFDLAAYGYTGPTPAEPQPEQVTLTFNVGDAVGEQVLAAFREMAAGRNTEPEAAVEDVVVEAPAPEPVAVAEPEQPAAEPEDGWAALTAHLTQDDAWSALVTNLIEPDTSSSAATA